MDNELTIAKTFLALGNVTRIRILKHLAKYRSDTYTGIAYALGFDMSKDAGTYSHHLRTLARNNLIKKQSNSPYKNQSDEYSLTEYAYQFLPFIFSEDESDIRKDILEEKHEPLISRGNFVTISRTKGVNYRKIFAVLYPRVGKEEAEYVMEAIKRLRETGYLGYGLPSKEIFVK